MYRHWIIGAGGVAAGRRILRARWWLIRRAGSGLDWHWLGGGAKTGVRGGETSGGGRGRLGGLVAVPSSWPNVMPLTSQMCLFIRADRTKLMCKCFVFASSHH